MLIDFYIGKKLFYLQIGAMYPLLLKYPCLESVSYAFDAIVDILDLLGELADVGKVLTPAPVCEHDMHDEIVDILMVLSYVED
jgi:hypothetical protein